MTTPTPAPPLAQHLETDRADLAALETDLAKLEALQAEHRAGAEAAKARYRTERKPRDLDEAARLEGAANAVSSILATTAEDAQAVRARIARTELVLAREGLLEEVAETALALETTQANYAAQVIAMQNALAAQLEDLEATCADWLAGRARWLALARRLGHPMPGTSGHFYETSNEPRTDAVALLTELQDRGVNTAALRSQAPGVQSEPDQMAVLPAFPIHVKSNPTPFDPMTEHAALLVARAAFVAAFRPVGQAELLERQQIREAQHAQERRSARARLEREAQAKAEMQAARATSEGD